MIKYFLIFCCCWSFSGAYGQFYFNNRYNFGYQDLGVDVVRSDNGFVIVSAESETGGLQWNLRFVILNNSGNVISNHSYGNTANYYVYQGSLAKIDTSGYAIAGGKLDSGGLKGYLMKIDLNGDSIWTRVFSGSADMQFFDCKQTSDGGFILAGITYIFDPNGDALLLKTDSNGNFQWEKHFGGNLYDDAKSVIQTFDGGYLIVGKKRTASSWSDGFIIKTDDNGNMQWNREYGGPFEDSFECCIQSNLDSSIFVSGSFCSNSINPPFGNNFNKPYLIKINVLGDTLWTKMYGDSLYTLGITSIAESLGGDKLVLCGNSPDPLSGRQNGLIMNVDSSGTLQWTNQYKNIFGVNSNNLLKELFLMSTGEILAVGNVYPNLPDTGNVDTWFLTTDSLGCLLPNCINSVNENDFDSENVFSVFPNPSSGYLTIKLFEEIKQCELYIYNSSGLIIYSDNFNENQRSTLIDLTKQSQGIYLAVLIIENNIIFKKFTIVE